MSSPLCTSPLNDFTFPTRPADYFTVNHHKKSPTINHDNLNESISSIETNHSLINTNVSSDTLVDDDYFKPPMKAPTPLQKQMTLPCFPLVQLQSFPSLTNSISFKSKIESLSPKIRAISKDIHPTVNDLLIDIRPFPEYMANHIDNGINICLPSTLLKRLTFTLQKCINSLPPFEQSKFNEYLSSSSHQNIFIYDSSSFSQNMFHFLSKITNSPLIDLSKTTIYIFEFNDFTDSSKLIKEPKSLNNQQANTTINNMLPPIDMEKCRSHSLTNISSSTPILSGFILPRKQSTNNFMLRHNEELISSALQSNTQHLFSLLIPENVEIPTWLNSTIKNSTYLNDNFHQLEKLEQARLLNALSTKKSEADDFSHDEKTPTISSGFEYGYKNRYKDIILYEQTRVKLNDFNNEDDYINASYISPLKLNDEKLDINYDSHFNYVAAQGPLNQTMGDFWYLIFKLQTSMIISLTDEIENGMIKCSPFWKSGLYYSGKLKLKVTILEQHQVNDHLIIRSIGVKHNNTTHNVLQVHLLSWPDMGTCSKPIEILQIIELKHHVLKNGKNASEYPTVIHCSAGCGRTGTLCAVDTLINILRQNEPKQFTTDPIFSIVNNLRQQRISMVQNLRQYYLIYDLMIYHLTCKDKQLQRSLIELPIIDSFIKC